MPHILAVLLALVGCNKPTLAPGENLPGMEQGRRDDGSVFYFIPESKNPKQDAFNIMARNTEVH